MARPEKRVAVVLSGCGFLDGSEIREAVGVLWALSQQSAQVKCFAPDAPQKDVMNTLSGKPSSGETRNILVESARIARGKIESLSELRPEDFHAIVLPGGFGAAKNLSDFATRGSGGQVLPGLKAKLQAFHAQHKPIGAVCIAPAVVALAFPHAGFELTVGEPGEAAQEITKAGHTHIVCAPQECHVDARHRIVSTPAYMYDDAPLHEIFEGIRKLVSGVMSLSA